MSQLSRKCGAIDNSKPYGPPRIVTRIALLPLPSLPIFKVLNRR
jgi:hypothetical protein